MQKTRKLSVIAAAVFLLIMILDSKTALSGAIQGVSLCIYTVVPALFPLFVLSNYITQSMTGTRIRFIQKAASVCGVPCGGESIFLIGLIGGYPVGAQCIKKAYDNGSITKDDACRLLGFCNNAGPAFIFGMASGLFASKWIPWILWLIQILSAIITGILLPQKRKYSIHNQNYIEMSFVSSMRQSIFAMANICGWVILFCVVSTFLTKWLLWYFPVEICVIFNGIIELVNGCRSLNMIQSESLRLILCASFLSAGGLCVYMQTMSVVGELGIKSYTEGKLIQTLISLIISIIVVLILFPGNEGLVVPLIVILTIFIIIMAFFKKSVAFAGRMIYNTKKSL